MNTIKPLSAIKTVGSSTADSEAKQQFQQQTRPGQIYAATVLGPAGRDRFFLNIYDQKILAQSDTVNLPPGTKLKLQVLSTTPLIELKIISDAPQTAHGKTITLLGKDFDITRLVPSVNPSSPSFVNTTSTSAQDGLKRFNDLQQYPLGSRNGGTVLKQLIDRLGLSLETLLTKGDSKNGAETLNATLLEMAVILKKGETIAETTNRLMSTLELHQETRLKLRSKNQLIYSLPFPFFDHGYLLVEKDQTNYQSEINESLLRFSLHLSLEPLGDIEIHFSQTGEDISIQFSCESEEKKQFISENQEDLKNSLSSSGVLNLSFSDTAGDPASDLFQQLIAEDESMLDTKV